MSRRRVTLSQVAKAAGVSVTTVSLILNNRPGTRIAQDTAQRVKKVAEELGYSPDPAATVLRTGVSGSIGFISDEVTVTRFASAMIRGALEVGEEQGKIVIMAETDRSYSRMENAIDMMLERRVDGLIIGLMHARKIKLPPIPTSLPTVIINGVADPVANVLPAEYAAGQAAANYLLQRGHKKVALIGRSPEHKKPEISATINTRMRGIDEAISQADGKIACEFEGVDWEPRLGYQAAQAMPLDLGITAIIAANDRIAFGIYQAFGEKGISIPEDISVISFDDEQLAEYLLPPITTMRLPYREMGRIGMEAVLSSFHHQEKTQLVPMPLIERASVRDLR